MIKLTHESVARNDTFLDGNKGAVMIIGYNPYTQNYVGVEDGIDDPEYFDEDGKYVGRNGTMDDFKLNLVSEYTPVRPDKEVVADLARELGGYVDHLENCSGAKAPNIRRLLKEAEGLRL